MVNTQRSCLRFYGTEKLVMYTAHEKKDQGGLDEDNILNVLSKETIVEHDHNKVNYNDDYIFENAEYLLWVYNFDVPFTNNLSERGLRGVKSKQKASGQFWKIESAEWYATIRTYIETCQRNKVNVYNALLKLVLGKPYTLKEILSGVSD